MLKRVLKHLKTLIIGVLKTADLHYLKNHKQHLMLFLQNLLIFFFHGELWIGSQTTSS